MFYPAKVEINFHIVCSHTKEYQSYKAKDPIISKFAGQRSCYASSGVCPSPAKKWLDASSKENPELSKKWSHSSFME